MQYLGAVQGSYHVISHDQTHKNMRECVCDTGAKKKKYRKGKKIQFFSLNRRY